MMRHLISLLLLVSPTACREKPRESKKAGAPLVQPKLVHPKPIRVTVRRDSLKASRATVGAAGGTLTAVGSDSSRFTLTIPPNALDGDSSITMTPVSAIDGLPLSGGLVAAAHFEPEGLRFNIPVELKIEPPREVPVEQQVGFGYLGDGNDLHLYPLNRGGALAMRLLHFSGVGVALGTSSDVGNLQQHSPTDAAAQLEQQIAAVVKADQDLALENDGKGDPEFSAKLAKLFQEYYDQVVLPKIDAAMHTDDWRVMFDAVLVATYFARASAMFGEESSALSKLLPLMEPILVRGFDRAYYRCIQKLGGDKEAGMLMIVARNAAMTLFKVRSDDPRFSQGKIQECFAGGTPLPKRLELSFESAFYLENPNEKATMMLGSTLTLDQVGGSTSYQTRAWTPIVYRDFNLTAGDGCSSFTDVKANDGSWKVDLMVHPDGKIGMMWNFHSLDGVPTEEMTIVPCPAGGGHPHPTSARWWWACLNQISSQDVQRAMEQGQGYVGLATGMTFFPWPGKLSSKLERKDFLCKQGVINLRLKVLPDEPA
jgi:hypothetical protein